MKTSDSFIFGGQIECDDPNLRMLSFSDVRLWEEMLVTVSLDVKGRVLTFIFSSGHYITTLLKQPLNLSRLTRRSLKISLAARLYSRPTALLISPGETVERQKNV